jgi:5-methylcytosine-specific restriction endonuclease McrA
MSSVLLLNASYEPLRVIDLPRAMGLLFAEKVELVEAVKGRELHSPNARHPLPSVLRMRRYINVPCREARWSRRAVFIRDGYTCAYCGMKLNAHTATLDHVVPQWECRSRCIPANTWTNTVTACGRCQTRKGGRSMREAGMRFHHPNFEPRIPRTRYLVLTSDIAPEWKQYIQI